VTEDKKKKYLTVDKQQPCSQASSQILSYSCGQKSFLHGCKTKSGRRTGHESKQTAPA